MRQKGLKTRLMLGESAEWDFGHTSLALLDSQVNQYVVSFINIILLFFIIIYYCLFSFIIEDIVATHAYGESSITNPLAFNKTANKSNND